MKNTTRLSSACIGALLFATVAAHAGETNGGSPPLIRADVLMLSMPEEKFLTIYPDLTDPGKIENAVAGLLDAVKRKEVVLEGCPMAVFKSGERASADTVMEWRYRGGMTIAEQFKSLQAVLGPDTILDR
jgi:hypothetical protein